MVEREVESVRELAPIPHISEMRQFLAYGDCEEVLKSRDFVQGAHAESLAFFGDSLLMLDGDAHFERRRLENKLFTKAALVYYESEALDPHIAQVIAEAAASGRGADGVVRADLCEMLPEMLARVTATITGIDGVNDPESTARFRYFVDQLGRGSQVEWSTEDHDEVVREIIEVRDQFVAEFYEASVQRRRDLIARRDAGELDDAELPTDLLTLMYANWNDQWGEHVPLNEATLFLVAAIDTTSHETPHVVRHLDEWFAAHPEDRARLDDPEFLRRAVYESIRLHLTAPALLREASCPVDLSSGEQVSAGELVACVFTGANRDESVFGSDVATFDLRRDTGELNPWGLGFGGGVHMCIGRPLVVGLPRTERSDGTDGSMVRILRALYAAGMELDPADPPSYSEASHQDFYARFPLLLRGL